MLSGPVAFLVLLFLSSLRIPSSLMSIMSITGNDVPGGVGMLVSVSLVNTDMYCLFRMCAFLNVTQELSISKMHTCSNIYCWCTLYSIPAGIK